MRTRRIVVPLLGTAFSMIFFAMTSFAQSPEFAYSKEKWATLRDDVLEYGELADLIHEYNPTVLNNRTAYEKERGKTNADARDDYADAVQEMYEASDRILEGADAENPAGYAAALAGSITTRIQAEQMQDAENEPDWDGVVKRLEYERQEKELVQSAQEKMNEYWKYAAQIESAQAELTRAQAKESAARARVLAGLSSNTSVLEAQSAVQSAQASIEEARRAMEEAARTLFVMTGWKYDANPSVQPIPDVSEEELSKLNTQGAQDRAVQENLALLAAKRRLTNLTAGTAKYEQLKRSIASGEQKVRSDVAGAIADLEQARAAREVAAEEAGNISQKTEQVKRHYEAGRASKNVYLEAECEHLQAQSAKKQADLALRQALETYEWAVSGLANAGEL